jgi:hypothetical protein
VAGSVRLAGEALTAIFMLNRRARSRASY